MQYALQESQNVASVWLLQQIGINVGADFAENDGIRLTAKDRQHLGIAIGGMQNGVNALQMAQAYEPFANNGVQIQVHLINKVVNQNGNVLYHYTPVIKNIMTASTAQTMTRLLQDVVDYGTGTAAQVPGVSIAGKTGTVQYSSGLTGYSNWIRNAWFDGYTSNLVGSIYIGYDNPSPTYHLTMSPLDPSANAAKIFGDITRLAISYGYPAGKFSVGPFPASGATGVTQQTKPHSGNTPKGPFREREKGSAARSIGARKHDTAAKPFRARKHDTAAKPSRVRKHDTAAKSSRVRKHDTAVEPATARKRDGVTKSDWAGQLTTGPPH